MPELPDLTVVAEAFDAALRGRPITSATAPGPLAVRGTPAELEALVGQTVTAIRRQGKFLSIDLDRDRIVVNACQGAVEDRGDPWLRTRPSSSWPQTRGVDEGRGLAPGG